MSGGSPIELWQIPGLGGSGPDHWQSRWERRYGDARLEQRSWDAPQWTTWSAALEARVARASGPVVLVAHSLGCSLVARWAIETLRAPRAALLVAPADIDAHAAALPAVQSFAPLSLRPLPFATTVVASDDDPYVSSERAALFARSVGERAGLDRSRGPHQRRVVAGRLAAGPRAARGVDRARRTRAARARGGLGRARDLRGPPARCTRPTTAVDENETRRSEARHPRL